MQDGDFRGFQRPKRNRIRQLNKEGSRQRSLATRSLATESDSKCNMARMVIAHPLFCLHRYRRIFRFFEVQVDSLDPASSASLGDTTFTFQAVVIASVSCSEGCF